MIQETSQLINLIAVVFCVSTSSALVAVGLTQPIPPSFDTQSREYTALLLETEELSRQNDALRSSLSRTDWEVLSLRRQLLNDSKPSRSKRSAGSQPPSTTNAISGPRTSQDENGKSLSAFDKLYPETEGLPWEWGT